MNRLFLDWHKPVAELAADVLLAGVTGQPLDLGDTLVVVPTRQAARRLRERLALAAQARGTMVLSPLIVQPEYFVRPRQAVASRAESLAALATVLEHMDYADYPQVFPGHAAQQARRFPWRLETAAMLIDLRRLLAESGLTVAAAAERLQAADPALPDPEPQRWQQLAALEAAFLDVLQAHGLRDPAAAQIAAAAQARLPDHIRKLVLMCVPDPMPLALQAWRTLEHQGVPLTVCVHAPETDAAFFDDWGRPLAENWATRTLDLPDTCVHLVPKPPDQAAMATRLLRQALQPRPGQPAPPPAGILALGVLDDQVLPHLEAAMAAADVPAFNPALKPVEQHALYHLVRGLLNLAEKDGYEDFSALLRNPPLLHVLERREPPVPVFDLLRRADDLQNNHMPASFTAVHRHAAARPAESDQPLYGPALLDACNLLHGWLQRLTSPAWPAELAAILEDVCAVRPATGPEAHAEQTETAAVLEVFADALDGMASPALERLLPPDSEDRRALFLQLLAQQGYSRAEADEPRVDLEGWLELHWNDAPVLILTGFNEGRVPAATVGHPFLPNSARRALGLPDNDARLARDSYLLAAMAAFRPQNGAVQVVFGKTTTEGDVLRPSRLLFRCAEDEALAARALRLFGLPEADTAAPAADQGWRLRPRWEEPRPKASVSALNDYLRCPFRFYLKHVLRMQAADDRKLEMDVLDFGTVCHEVLSHFAEDAKLRDCTDERVLAEFLVAEAESLMRARYGHELSAALALQAESLMQRLRHAARCQAAARLEGWRLFPLNGHYAEHGMSLMVDDFQVTARIDRIDEHERTGALRIMDYKTSDKAKTPKEVHLAGAKDDMPPWRLVTRGDSVKAWHNLQLPVYRLLAQQQFPGTALECAYFLLPRAVTQTAIPVFTELDADLLASAEQCMTGIVDAIRDRQFWPPAAIPADFDDFARLCSSDWGDAFDLSAWPPPPPPPRYRAAPLLGPLPPCPPMPPSSRTLV